jgi:hypothetical protein
VESITATTATFHGVLQSAASAPSEAGVYKFLYKAGSTCTGGIETAPEISMGLPAESVFEPVGSLTAGTEYTVCVVVRNSELAPKEAQSAPFTFTTATPPEKPVTEAPKPGEVTATTAVLHGTLNPVKAGEAGTYEFTYQRSATGCNREFGAPEPAGTMTGTKEQAVSVTVTKLEPNQTYTFCLVTINKVGESTVGNLVTFKTAVSKPTLISESVSGVNATEAHLEAVVSPNNESTECRFQWGKTSVTENEKECEQGNALEGGEQGVELTVTGLEQNTVYHYRVLLKNATGEEKGAGGEHFTTAIHPETPETGKAEPVTTTTATLHGVLNPGAPGNPGSYEFVYRQSPSECELYNYERSRFEPMNATPAETSLGNAKEAAKPAVVDALLPNTTYTFCLLARNEAGETALGAPVTFATPPAAPKIENESSSHVSATEARLEAEIDPGNSETAYHFEYGPAAGSYDVSVPVPDAKITAGLTVKARARSRRACNRVRSTITGWSLRTRPG